MYSPVIKFPLLDISARSNNPRECGGGPSSERALTRSGGLDSPAERERAREAGFGGAGSEVWEIVVVAVTRLDLRARKADWWDVERGGERESLSFSSTASLSLSSSLLDNPSWSSASSSSSLAAAKGGVPTVISVLTPSHISLRLSSLASLILLITPSAPGNICAFTICAQLPILCSPPRYCILTVFPISPNLRSSNIRKRCFVLNS